MPYTLLCGASDEQSMLSILDTKDLFIGDHRFLLRFSKMGEGFFLISILGENFGKT